MRNKLTPDMAPTRDGHSAGVTRVSNGRAALVKSWVSEVIGACR